ncbi:BQ5605_C036g11506 [Microbotryum silenes-dioicae]|uniref:ATP-dependent DNA helicase n=1 Tax=Microbotryum silenes-dioicae TaxID=796604 RepID=A0A2X0PAH3_9BASI|nr:BQ5605_C036g11506 [Microbotryum silenes-dioicae]
MWKHRVQRTSGDPKQCLPVTLNGSVRWSDRRVGRQRLPVIPKSSSTQIVNFVDAPGGTGKTFLEETVLARIRSEGTYALAVASSGIAALLLPKGSTAHSRFKIPIDMFDDSTCNLPKQGQLAELWDEAPMQHRRCFQLVDRVLQDVRSSVARLGGLTVVLAVNPKQCLPVVLKSSPRQIVDACIMNADFWVEVEVLLDFVRLRIRVIGTPNILNGSVRWSDRRVDRPATTTARARAFRSGPTQFFAEPCLYRINIDVCEVARGARRRT